MTSTTLGIQDAILEAATAPRVETEDAVLYGYECHYSPRSILLSHQGVDTNLPVFMRVPIYAGQVLPTALYYVAPWNEPLAVGSTGLINVTPQTEEAIRSHLERLIALSADEVFLDGMESRLSYGLKQLLGISSSSTIQVIRSLMDSGTMNAEVVGEILRVFGDFEDSITHHSRLSVLLECLRSKDSRIRDAASLGIASLDDPAALQEVNEAMEREPLPMLREDLQLVVDQLRAGRCQHS